MLNAQSFLFFIIIITNIDLTWLSYFASLVNAYCICDVTVYNAFKK